jgi:hypothetical protein
MDITDPSAPYALVGEPLRNVVVLRMPTDPTNERSKMLIADRDTLTLEQVPLKNHFRVVLRKRDTNQPFCRIELHHIHGGHSRLLRSKQGLRKTEVTLFLNRLFDPRALHLEKIVVIMNRTDAWRFGKWFVGAWTLDTRHQERWENNPFRLAHDEDEND